MSDQAPRVAVIIPTFNDRELVAETVHSISEPEPVEVVVVDDASDDPTSVEALRALEAEGVRVIRHETNQHVIASRASALAATGAPYVFPLDADDLAVPGMISRMADTLEREQADVCFGDYEEFGEHAVIRAVPGRLDLYRLIYTDEYPITSLFRRTVLEEVGGWAAKGWSERASADWNLWVTLAERGVRTAHMGRGVITYRKRVHQGRITNAVVRRKPQLYRAVRRHHPEVVANLRRYRRQSDLSPLRKLLYPVVYGGRPRFAFEPVVKRWLDRVGVWTLRR